MKNTVGLAAIILIPFITLLGGCGPGSETTYAGTVSTIAGTGTASSVDGAGTLAGFHSPADITSDGTNLYVADTGNDIIRKIDLAVSSIPVTTFVDTGEGLFNPSGITSDGVNLYVADSFNHVIRKVVIETGVVTTLAGTVGVFGSTDSPALFKNPSGVTTDGTNLYVADTGNHLIRKIAILTEEVTTIAGDIVYPAGGFLNDPVGLFARFNNPSGITMDGIYLYVADTSNHAIRRIDISSIDAAVTTIVGDYPTATPGVTNGVGAAARFNSPEGIVRDGIYLYVADSGNHTIRQIDIATSTASTLAGVAGSSGSVDGEKTIAKFNSPVGITTDGTSLYVTDTGNHTIRKIQ